MKNEDIITQWGKIWRMSVIVALETQQNKLKCGFPQRQLIYDNNRCLCVQSQSVAVSLLLLMLYSLLSPLMCYPSGGCERKE